MNRWKTQLRLRMMFSHVAGAITLVLLLEIACAGVMFFIVHPSSQTASTLFYTHLATSFLPIALFVLLITVPVAMLCSLIATRGLINRMQRLVDATAGIVAGHYERRLTVPLQQKVGMLELFEQQFNVIAEQLMRSIQQRQLLSEQNARFAERAHIFRDLHDGVKQQVFALTMQISTARALIDAQPELARAHLDNSTALAYEMQQELTALIHSSRPSALDEKGLTTALQEYVTVWSRQQQIPVQQHIESFASTPLLEEALLRIMQEGLSNIARHSQATFVRLEISYSRKEQEVRLLLEDNGCGFDSTASALSSKGGIGLQSMRERIEALHGTFSIESSPGTGTRIVALCPYQDSLSDHIQPSTAHLSNKEVVR
jgi:signal transduction histidine kinase